jgi:GntR family galactonate operon transcriptional repressor
MLMRTRHQDTVDRIAEWIVGGRFQSRAVLPTEEEIGGELGVSRTVVREAMRTLVAKGMVEVRRRHGTTVKPVDSWSLFDPQVVAWRITGGLTREFVDDLIGFRLGIEPHAAELAAQNPKFPAATLENAYRRMAAAVEGEGDYHSADLDFHEAIIVGSNNQFLRQLVPLIANTLRVSFSLSVISMDTARGSLPMHREVADAIIAREPERARKALAKLIEAAREDILGVLPDMLWEERANGERNRLPVQGP